MTIRRFTRSAVASAAWAVLAATGNPALAAPTLNWVTVANNATPTPDGSGRSFFSYNQPSVSDDGSVVFRGRARGGAGSGGSGGAPLRGVFVRDMADPLSTVSTVASTGGATAQVPGPNNTNATFNEFPAFARSDARTGAVVFRGQSEPVLEVEISPGDSTRVGTSGVYTNATGSLSTGASLLGNIQAGGFDFGYFQVPGASPGTRFDQFPGAPTVTGSTVVFKGNWTDGGNGQTGIYARDLAAGGGTASVVKLAASGDTFVQGGQTVTLGSTAPPSASDGRVVFTGLDNEAAPTAGGIFVTALSDATRTLRQVVAVGLTAVGNAVGDTFRAVGEGLSFDGRKVGFWGAWGSETRSVTVPCPADGNASVIQSCLSQDTNGTAGDGIYTFDVPLHQGIFTVDVDTGDLKLVAQTDATYADFLFWTFSGAPDDAGGESTDGREPPHWRSSAFVAVDDDRTVFKGLTVSGLTGLYGDLGHGVETLLDTSMDGSVIDPAAAGMRITAVGIERDGFRNGWLAINASMANDDASWAGVYVTFVPEPATWALALGGVLAAFRRRGAARRATVAR